MGVLKTSVGSVIYTVSPSSSSITIGTLWICYFSCFPLIIFVTEPSYFSAELWSQSSWVRNLVWGKYLQSSILYHLNYFIYILHLHVWMMEVANQLMLTEAYLLYFLFYINKYIISRQSTIFCQNGFAIIVCENS
jgi:hypothetical protein